MPLFPASSTASDSMVGASNIFNTDTAKTDIGVITAYKQGNNKKSVKRIPRHGRHGHTGVVLAQKFWQGIAPSAPSSPSPFYLFSETTKNELHTCDGT